MKEKNRYTPEDLQRKTFTIEIKGYKVEEINDFLDDIQRDYFYFLTEIETLRDELSHLRIENTQLAKNQELLRNENQILNENRIKMTKNELSNSDVMSRMSHIESSLEKIFSILEKLTSR